MRFCPPEPSFSGISSTKSRFLCAFALRDPCFRAFRAQNRGFCARLLNWMSGLGHFPADRGIVAPAQPILPLTLPPLHLRSRFSCGVAALAEPSYLRRAMPSAVACRRLPPVPPVLPLLPPLHLLSRCTCVAAVPSAVACSRLPPVPLVLPLLPPLHLRSRCICADDTTAAFHRCT